MAWSQFLQIAIERKLTENTETQTETAENKIKIANEGIGPIITALKTHSSNPGVCEKACGALCSLAVNGVISVFI